MKRKFALILILVSHLYLLDAQTSLIINKLYVSHYDMKYIVVKYREDDEDGPHIGVDFVIKNNSKSDTVELVPSKSDIYIEFKYRGNTYNKEISPLFHVSMKSVKLSPQDSCSLSFGVPIFLGTLILKNRKQNYTKELLEILPTIKIVYKQKDLKLISDEIMVVNVSEQ